LPWRNGETRRHGGAKREECAQGLPDSFATLRLCGSTVFLSLVQGRKQGNGEKRSEQISTLAELYHPLTPTLSPTCVGRGS
jgi:hypothetical protein